MSQEDPTNYEYTVDVEDDTNLIGVVLHNILTILIKQNLY